MATAVKIDRRIAGPAPRITRATYDGSTPPAVRPKWNLLERQKDKNRIAALERKIAEMEKEPRMNKTAVTKYGSKDQLAEVKERVTLMPNAQQLGEKGIALVAQVAYLMDLNPFTDLHAFTNKGRFHLMVDYKALIRQADADGDLSWDTRAMTPAERQDRALDDDEIGYVTEIVQISKAQALHAIGMAKMYKPIKGYGIAKLSESPPHGRDIGWLAGKRSVRDAMNQIADFSEAAQRINAAIHSASGGEYEETADGWSMNAPPVDGEQPIIIDQDTGEVTDADQQLIIDECDSACVKCGGYPADPTNPEDPKLCQRCAKMYADRRAAEDELEKQNAQ